ncbi:cysteine desulfurase-like protein, partial [Actinokineospora sp.]|uniref:cysteine desulfurase-like protein n=1 Tax=Actinokineospora sp. TaxID=1872133 RepID=UPI003D6BAB1B
MTATTFPDAVTAFTAQVRAAFPALDRRHRGVPVAYFDGPGGTQVPQAVVDAVADYLLHHNANTDWHYPTSHETDAMIAEARTALADFLGGRPDEVAFGANMTTLTFHLARALGRRWGAGDEIVVTDLDHHAIVAPWRALGAERGVVVRAVPFHRDAGELDWDAFEAAVSPRTRLVAVGAASNALGTVNDVARAARLARGVGALLFVDAVHSAPHVLPDVRALDADFLACSAYKFYGPHIGVLWSRRELLAGLDVPKLEPAPDTVPDRIETGTLSHEGIAGTLAAVEFLASLAGNGREPAGTVGNRRERLAATYRQLRAEGERLGARLWNGLAAIPGVTLYGPRPGRPRTPTVAFAVRGRTSHDVAKALADQAVFVSSGDFYAATVLERLGYAQDGLVRAGCACYTTDEEVDRLVTAVAGLQ